MSAATTRDPARTPAAFAERGPHPVGVVHLDLPCGSEPGRRLPTDVWYPADAADFESHAEASHAIGAPHAARQAPPAAALAGLPLVGFSHGNSGFRQQSTFLTTHLASWGFVVTAPDHSGNTFFEMAQVEDEDQRIRIHKDARARRPADLAAAIRAVLEGDGPWPEVDPARVGACGHSYGGWTALKMPRQEPRVRAVCGLAPASEAFVGKKAWAAGELPLPCPSLIVSALDDVLVDVDGSIRPLHDRLRDSTLVGIRDADHFHFCDHLQLLHGFHEKNSPRPQQTRATRPYAELLPEDRTHRLVRGLVTSFFANALGPSAGAPALGPDELAALDAALERLDTPTRASA